MKPNPTDKPDIDPAISSIFSQYGKKGGIARAEKLTKAQRTAAARRAIKARWKIYRADREKESGSQENT